MSPRSTLPSAMEQLVASTDPPNPLATIAVEKNTLLERRSFKKVGTSRGDDTDVNDNITGAFAVTPHVLHFGGFTLGKRHTQTFKVTNTGSISNRLVVLPPATEFFKLGFSKDGLNKNINKPGKLAAGASEYVTIEFHPDDGLRYYYDCVLLHVENAPGIVVPIHADPVMNEVVFPNLIDFGLRECGKTHSITKTITCKVPINFEFEVTIKSKNMSNDKFTVAPASGIVPAQGSVPVTITYAPSSASTALCEISVSISQFGSKPFVCAVRGTGFPSGVKKPLSNQSGGNNKPVTFSFESEYDYMYGSSNRRPQPPPVQRPPTPQKSSNNSTAKNILAQFELRAAGYDKNVAEEMVRRNGDVNVTGGLVNVRPSGNAPPRGPRGRKLIRATSTSPEETNNTVDTSSDEELIDGVFVPKHLRKGSDFIKVLNQKKGKLRMRDIEKVIELRDKQVASAVTLRKSMATATGAINKMKASAAAATFRKLLVASKVERKLDRDDGDGVDYDPGDQTHNSDNGTDQTRAFQTGLDALKTVVSAAKFRSKSENETMAALDDPDLDDDVKAVLFEREFSRVVSFEREKEWTDCVAVGESVFSKDEQLNAHRRRKQRGQALRYVEASAAMARLARGEPTTVGASYYVELMTQEKSETVSTQSTQESRQSSTQTYSPQLQAPQFNPLSADDWPKRREALDRFVQAGRRVIIRNRGEKRLKGVRNLFAAGGDASKVSAYAAKDLMGAKGNAANNITAASANASHATADSLHTWVSTRLVEDEEARFGVARLDGLREGFGACIGEGNDDRPAIRVKPRLFPKTREAVFATRLPIKSEDMASINGWDEVTTLKPISPLTYKLKGYEALEECSPPKLEGDGTPPTPGDTPALRLGATEEETSGVLSVARIAADAEPIKTDVVSALRFAQNIAPDVSTFGVATDYKSNPTRYSPKMSQIATPPFMSSSGGAGIDDIDSRVLPGVYGFEDGLSNEKVGVNTVRTIAIDTSSNNYFLALRWTRKRTGGGIGGLIAPMGELTSWLTGPDPADLMEDGDGEGGEVVHAAPVPSVASVAEEIKALLGGGETETSDEEGHSIVVPGGIAQRSLFEREMDAAIEKTREDVMASLEMKAKELDAKIVDPQLRWRIDG